MGLSHLSCLTPVSQLALSDAVPKLSVKWLCRTASSRSICQDTQTTVSKRRAWFMCKRPWKHF